MLNSSTQLANQDHREYERRFQNLKFKIHRRLIENIDLVKIRTLSQVQLQNEIWTLANEIVQNDPELLTEIDKDRLVSEIIHEVFGLGPLQSLLSDPTITDILVNGPNEVYIDRDGRLEETDIIFANRAHLTQIIQRVVAKVGRRADETSPMVDARLEDGSRVNAILPPLAASGPILSIRRFAKRLTMSQLINNSTLTPEIRTFLEAAVKCRLSIIISGGTGSGKTTMLNCLSRCIPSDERLITIEDALELSLQRKHVVQLETRNANLEGSGEVLQRELVRNSLRMRPDRIIVGEVRGPEALDMLQAMNTGHEGSLTTVHANDTRDALSRLEMMVMMTGFEMPVTVIRQYIASAIALVVQVTRLKGGQRKVMRVSEIVRMQGDDYEVRDLFGFRQEGIRSGAAFGSFYATGEVPDFLPRMKSSGIELPEHLFEKRDLSTATAVESASEAEISLEPWDPEEKVDLDGLWD